MIGEQELDHPTLRFLDFFALGCDDHAVRASDGAGSLKLRHLLDADKAHAARRLKREVGVIAEGGNREALLTADINQPRALCYLKILIVDSDFD